MRHIDKDMVDIIDTVSSPKFVLSFFFSQKMYPLLLLLYILIDKDKDRGKEIRMRLARSVR